MPSPIKIRSFIKPCYAERHNPIEVVILIGFLESDITFNFMTSTVNCTDEFSSKCSAVTHIDGTARPHVIRKDSDPCMWDVVSQWFKKTGEYALINTSFNTHEEPIICTVDDALEILLNGTIDVLYVESQRVSLR